MSSSILRKNFPLPHAMNNPLIWILALGIAPWLLGPLAYGRWGVAAAIVFMSVSIAGLGFLTLLYLDFFHDRPSLRIAFAPGMGLIVRSGLLYLAVRFEVNNALVYFIICAIGFMGVTLHIKLTRYSYNRLMFCNKG